MTSAAIYCRVASAPRRNDPTIDWRTAAVRAHAERLGLRVPEERVFADAGYSGMTLVRPGLQRLRDTVAGAGVDVVLCDSPDRLARTFAHQALLIEEFARTGTRVEFVHGGWVAGWMGEWVDGRDASPRCGALTARTRRGPRVTAR
jgi:site-specific DNA recombinase